MKTSTLATRLMMAAIFLTVLIYFGVNLAAYFMDPYTATTAYAYTGEKSVTVSGYVVRDEEVLPGGGELVYSARSEGERVSGGGTVALIYQSPQALDDANTLRALEDQLAQLLYARSLASGSQTSARLDEEIASSLIAFRRSLASGSLTAAGDQGASLRTSVLKRSYAYSGTGDLEASIAALQAQISALSASASSGATRVSAPQAGLFSSLVDGYETVLNRTDILQLTPSAYRAIAPVAGTAGVGKMVYGTGWSFLTMMRSEDIGRMQEGDTVTLRFQKGLERDMEMRVSHISVEDGGRRVVAVELDPPADDDISFFLEGVRTLRDAGADAVTIADCPIGRPRADSSLLACKIKRELGVEPLPHMTCRDRNRNAAKALLLGLSMEGVHNVLLVTGDPIPSEDRDEVKSVFNFNSRRLAAYVSGLNETVLRTPFCIFGALNVNAKNFDQQLRIALEKEENGVSGFLTQPVLSREALENLKTARRTLRGKILGGIYPVVSHKNACFLNNEIAGMHISEEIVSLYEGRDREEAEELAVAVSARIAEEIAPCTDGLYLMTPFRRVALMARILERLAH